jgi:hypothetical protein
VLGGQYLDENRERRLAPLGEHADQRLSHRRAAVVPARVRGTREPIRPPRRHLGHRRVQVGMQKREVRLVLLNQPLHQLLEL